MGYLLCPTNVPEWLIFAVATLLLFFPGIPGGLGVPIPKIFVYLVGIGLWVLVYAMQKVRIKK